MESTQPEAATSSFRVVVVDDDMDHAVSLADGLRDWGWDATVAKDGRSALEVIAASPPDIVMLDLGMLGMNGFELATRIRALPEKKALLIAVTGQSTSLSMARAMAAGIDAYMIKPLRLDRLRGDVETLMAERLGQER